MTALSGAGQSNAKLSAESAAHVARDECGPAALAVLLERAGRGDQTAFASVYDATSARTFGLALRVLGDPAEAEEALHDAYLEIWRRCGRLEAAGVGAMAWILTIVHRAAVQRLRYAATAEVGDPHTHTRSCKPVGAPPARLAQVVPVEGCGTRSPLSELSDQQRGAITLAYFAGHTYSEVGHILGFGPRRALSLIRDGLVRLQERPELA